MSSTSKAASTGSSSRSPSQTPTSYLSYPVSHVVSGLYRRLTEPSPNRSAIPRLQTHTSDQDLAKDMPNGVYTPPHRTASPFQPPPLTPLTLCGSTSSTILSRAVAEEIRLLIPPRLQLAEQWSLAYSLEEDGVSLGTLYNRCAAPNVPRDASFVLVVQDGAGGVGLFQSDIFVCSSIAFSNGNSVPDFRRLLDLVSTPFCLLLWQRGMLPVARFHPSLFLSPLQSPASTVGTRYREHRPEYHDREPDIPFPFPIASFAVICNEW